MPVNAVTNLVRVNLHCSWTTGVETINNNYKTRVCFLKLRTKTNDLTNFFPSTLICDSTLFFFNAVKIFLSKRSIKVYLIRKVMSYSNAKSTLRLSHLFKKIYKEILANQQLRNGVFSQT